MKRPSMPFYGRDFFGSQFVRRLPPAMQLHYLRMLWDQWDEGGLPADPEEIRTMLGLDAKEWRVTWAKLEPRFPLMADGQRRNLRNEEVRAEADEYTASKVKGGRERAASAPREGGKFTSKPPADHQQEHQQTTSTTTSKPPAEPPAAHQPASASASASASRTQGEAGCLRTNSGDPPAPIAASPPWDDRKRSGRINGPPTPIGDEVQRQLERARGGS